MRKGEEVESKQFLFGQVKWKGQVLDSIGERVVTRPELAYWLFTATCMQIG